MTSRILETQYACVGRREYSCLQKNVPPLLTYLCVMSVFNKYIKDCDHVSYFGEDQITFHD